MEQRFNAAAKQFSLAALTINSQCKTKKQQMPKNMSEMKQQWKEKTKTDLFLLKVVLHATELWAIYLLLNI